MDDPGAGAHWSEATREIRAAAYGSFLCWVEQRGVLDPEAEPAHRLRPEWVSGWLRTTRARVSARTADQMLIDLSLAAKVMVPGVDWSWMRRLAERPTPVEVRQSRRAPPEAPDTIMVAVGALQLCDEASAIPANFDTAILYRDALMVAVAACHALRLRNLAEITIGEHLVQVAPDHWHLTFNGTKTGERFAAELAKPLMPYLERYLGVYRPVLLKDRIDDGSLWISGRHRSLSRLVMCSVFKRVGRRLGVPNLTVHAMRHGMATGLLKRNPRQIKTAAAALTHRGVGSVNRFYDRSGATVARAEWRRLRKAKQRHR